MQQQGVRIPQLNGKIPIVVDGQLSDSFFCISMSVFLQVLSPTCVLGADIRDSRELFMVASFFELKDFQK